MVSEEHPDRSALLLAAGGERSEDGLLQVGEIFELALRADLVVLSACETGVGARRRGEGLVGLSRAFLYAGARSLLASLWQVADASTAELMTALYRRLVAGEPPAAALRGAKLELLGREELAHPFYWAPFVLLGDAAP